MGCFCCFDNQLWNHPLTSPATISPISQKFHPNLSKYRLRICQNRGSEKFAIGWQSWCVIGWPITKRWKQRRLLIVLYARKREISDNNLKQKEKKVASNILSRWLSRLSGAGASAGFRNLTPMLSHCPWLRFFVIYQILFEVPKIYYFKNYNWRTKYKNHQEINNF